MQLYKSLLKLVFAALVLFTPSCATICSKSTYPVFLSTTPTNAKVTITDRHGKVLFTDHTPSEVAIKSGSDFFTRAKYYVTFEMDGYEAKTIPLELTVDGWYFANLALFPYGLIGMLVVDPISGSMWKLNRNFVDATLTPVSNETANLQILDYNTLPDALKEKLEPINMSSSNSIK